MDTIIFDVDDTLYDQLLPFENAFNRTFKHLSHIQIDQLFIASRKHSDALFDKSEAGQVSLLELHTHRIMTAFKDLGHSITYEDAIQFQEIYGQEQKKITLFPETKRLLDILYSKNKQLAVLTNGPYEHQLMKIDQLGLLHWIPKENFFISEGIGTAKPHQNAFLYVEERLGLTNNKTVYIGDSFTNDIVGAKQVNWNAIWMNHRRREAPITTIKPDNIVYSARELFDLMNV